MIELHINAFELFRGYLDNPALREAVVTQGDQLATLLKEKEKSLQHSMVEEALTPEEQWAALQKTHAELQKTVQDAADAGIPFGWNSERWETATASWCDVLLAFVALFASGLLIGLGGPFWYDLFKRLSVLTHFVQRAQPEIDAVQGVLRAPTPEERKRRLELMKARFENSAQAWQLLRTDRRDDQASG